MILQTDSKRDEQRSTFIEVVAVALRVHKVAVVRVHLGGLLRTAPLLTGDGVENVISAVADRLRREVAGLLCVARTGPEELALMLAPLDVAGASAVTKQVARSVAHPLREGCFALTLAPSVGVAIGPGASAACLFDEARPPQRCAPLRLSRVRETVRVS